MAIGKKKSKRRNLNENWFSGGYLGPGLGMDWSMSPAQFNVQKSATGYVYSMNTFTDELQQKPNAPSHEYYIHPGCMVRGVGFNNPDRTYTGKVYRIVKNGNGEVIALYILATKTSKFVSIKADDNLELLIPDKPTQGGIFNPQSTELTPSNSTYAAQ